MSAAVTLDIVHDTQYHYAGRVDLAYHLAMLKPQDSGRQRTTSFALDCEPRPSYRQTGTDAFGNHRDLFSIYAPHDELHVRSTSRVVLVAAPASEVAASQPWERVRVAMRYRAGAPYLPATEFAFASPYVPIVQELADYARPCFAAGRPVLAGAEALMQRIHEDFEYATASTQVDTPLMAAFVTRRGVCQDFAHVMIGCLRALGLAARYVSGYLLTQPPPGQPRLVGADASHAWVSVFCPDLGWLDFDPTNAVITDVDHVVVATGRDFADVTPLRGVIHGGGEHTLDVAVTVAPYCPAP